MFKGIERVSQFFQSFRQPSFIEKESGAIGMGGKNYAPKGRWSAEAMSMSRRYGGASRDTYPKPIRPSPIDHPNPRTMFRSVEGVIHAIELFPSR